MNAEQTLADNIRTIVLAAIASTAIAGLILIDILGAAREAGGL